MSVIGMQTLVVYVFLMGHAIEDTVHELQLMVRIAKVKFNELSLSALLACKLRRGGVVIVGTYDNEVARV